MKEVAVLKVKPLGFPWETSDSFLFCVHHDDAYPAGNEKLGPAASLQGRAIGHDFKRKDGWRMYHGAEIPGFPGHPHRGFETVTVVRRGVIDHADSLGASARYGAGDVQWLTTGRGIVHSEMFPLLDPERPNPLELFQIWLNLPSEDKLVEPHFAMFWADAIPRHEVLDDAGRSAVITLIAGQLGSHKALPPPPKSWAARERSDVAIWTLSLAPHARFTLPAAQRGSHRTLYFFGGTSLRVETREVAVGHAIELRADSAVALQNGPLPGELLLLQGQPILEPVVQHGPFVMNSRTEIQRAFVDYQNTQFGGWPWPSDDPVHARDAGRFARHADGRIERPG